MYIHYMNGQVNCGLSHWGDWVKLIRSLIGKCTVLYVHGIL